MIVYDAAAAKEIERSYSTPEVARQRARTLAGLALRPGDHVLDAGCGTGFLVADLAAAVGPRGQVVGIDSSAEMLRIAAKRCRGLGQVRLEKGSVSDLPEKTESFHALACVQTLVYVPEVRKALAELHRVLIPGGRIAVIETDWQGVVLSSSYDALSRRMLAAWDSAVANPHLAVRLRSLLQAQGFNAVRVEAIPILNTSYAQGYFSVSMVEWVAQLAQQQGAVTAREASDWLADLRRLGKQDAYFFCVNRFLFTGIKK